MFGPPVRPILPSIRQAAPCTAQLASNLAVTSRADRPLEEPPSTGTDWREQSSPGKRYVYRSGIGPINDTVFPRHPSETPGFGCPLHSEMPKNVLPRHLTSPGSSSSMRHFSLQPKTEGIDTADGRRRQKSTPALRSVNGGPTSCLFSVPHRSGDHRRRFP